MLVIFLKNKKGFQQVDLSGITIGGYHIAQNEESLDNINFNNGTAQLENIGG